MALQVTWPTLNESNDENLLASLTTNQPSAGTALNLTGLTVEAYLKPARTTADGDAAVWKGSTATSGVTVTNAAGGLIEVAIPAAAVTTAKGWLRIDVVTGGGLRKTAAYGAVTVTDL